MVRSAINLPLPPSTNALWRSNLAACSEAGATSNGSAVPAGNCYGSTPIGLPGRWPPPADLIDAEGTMITIATKADRQTSRASAAAADR